MRVCLPDLADTVPAAQTGLTVAHRSPGSSSRPVSDVDVERHALIARAGARRAVKVPTRSAMQSGARAPHAKAGGALVQELLFGARGGVAQLAR